MEQKPKVDREIRKQLLEARGLIEAASKADCNEAETRRRVERIFETVLGFEPFTNITREHAVRGAGEAEYCDFAVIIDDSQPRKPFMMVEIKRVNIELAAKHLGQVAAYAINAGCEWLLLTNGKDWRLYHVTFGQPPETTLVETWHLLTDDLPQLAEKFALINLRNLKRSGLTHLWQKRNVLTPRNLLKVLLADETMVLLRRSLRRGTGVAVAPEEIVSALRRMFNDTALSELEGIKISLVSQKAQAVKARRTRSSSERDQEKLLPAVAEQVPPSEDAPISGSIGDTQPDK